MMSAGEARLLAVADLAQVLAAVLAPAQVAAGRAHRVVLPLTAPLPVSFKVPLPAPVVQPVAVVRVLLVGLAPVVAVLARRPAVAVAHLPNRRWSSAAMVRTTP